MLKIISLERSVNDNVTNFYKGIVLVKSDI